MASSTAVSTAAQQHATVAICSSVGPLASTQKESLAVVAVDCSICWVAQAKFHRELKPEMHLSGGSARIPGNKAPLKEACGIILWHGLVTGHGREAHLQRRVQGRQWQGRRGTVANKDWAAIAASPLRGLLQHLVRSAAVRLHMALTGD